MGGDAEVCRGAVFVEFRPGDERRLVEELRIAHDNLKQPINQSLDTLHEKHMQKKHSHRKQRGKKPKILLFLNYATVLRISHFYTGSRSLRNRIQQYV